MMTMMMMMKQLHEKQKHLWNVSLCYITSAIAKWGCLSCAKCKNSIIITILYIMSVCCLIGTQLYYPFLLPPILLLTAHMYSVSFSCIHLTFMLCVFVSWAHKDLLDASSFICCTYMDPHIAHNTFHMLVWYVPFPQAAHCAFSVGMNKSSTPDPQAELRITSDADKNRRFLH